MPLRFPQVVAVLTGLLLYTPCADADVKTHARPQPLIVGESALLDHRAFQETYTDDLDDLIRRRIFRVLVTYNRTNFFLEKGNLRGYEYELMQQYSKYLKTRVRNRSWPVIFAFIPVRFDQLLPALAAGQGDIVAAGLTVTSQRKRLVSFTEPYIMEVKEIVVTSKSLRGVKTLQDLSGRQIYVNKGTSYAIHLRVLNEQFKARGLRPIEIVHLDAKLTTEDILELVHTGVIDVTVADHHVAEFWAEMLPGIEARQDLVVNRGGQIAWAVRKENPELLRSLNQAILKNRQGTRIGNVLLRRYFENTEFMGNPLEDRNLDKLRELQPLFAKYGELYGFDWLTLAALAYQESGFDQSVTSEAGAVGLMQVLPKTAKAPPISVADVYKIENNIHAGVKYLAFLREKYFSDPEVASTDQIDFVLAGYNAGPTTVNRLRRLAGKEGLNPNKWFSNVEIIARRVIGREMVEYVANIYKYYVAYRLASRRLQEKKETIKSINRERGD